MDFDDLWQKSDGGAQSWAQKVPPDVRKDIDGLVELIVEKGSEPNWKRVFQAFKAKHPEHCPASDTTIKDNIRRLVDARK